MITSSKITLLLIENLNKLRLEIREHCNRDFKTTALDALVFKLCNTCFSFCTVFNSENISKNTNFKDISSLYTLSRSAIENFLTIEYLFLNSCSNDEKEFRLELWILSGILSRHKNHKNAPLEYRQKLDEEIREFETRKKLFYNLNYYKTLDIKEKNRLKNQLKLFGNSRFDFSWYKLIDKSNIGKDLFLNHYNLSSNYAHSEYHSIVQIRDLEFYNIKKDYETFTTPILNMINIMCSKLFLLIYNYNDLTNKVNLEKDYDIDLINFYSKIFPKTP